LGRCVPNSVEINPSTFGGDVRTKFTGQTDGQTDGVIPVYPPNFVAGGITSIRLVSPSLAPCSLVHYELTGTLQTCNLLVSEHGQCP
jgi:hypothetical protein